MTDKSTLSNSKMPVRHGVLLDGAYIDLTLWEPRSDKAKAFKAMHLSLGMDLCPTPTYLLHGLSVNVGVDDIHFLPPSVEFSTDYPLNIASVFLFDRYACSVGYDIECEDTRTHIIEEAQHEYQKYSAALLEKLNHESVEVASTAESK